MLTSYLCPQGHDSTDADYCSECGTKILGLGNGDSSSSTAVSTAISSASPETICPDCTSVHHLDDGQFCGICGYNFSTGAHGEIPVPAAASPPAPVQPVPQASQWAVEISVSQTPHDPASPLPPDRPAQKLLLTKSVNLIGRTSQIRAIYPEISLDFDDAVSQRHGLLSLQPDGSLIFRDIGSSNGTCLNGVIVTVMADLPLQAGDGLTLGHWTKLLIVNS